MEQEVEVIRRRIDELGTREPTIVRQGDNRIVVQVPGLQDPSALKALIGKTAKLEFKLVDTDADPAARRPPAPPRRATRSSQYADQPGTRHRSGAARWSPATSSSTVRSGRTTTARRR